MKVQFSQPEPQPLPKRDVTITLSPKEAVSLLAFLNKGGTATVDLWRALGSLLVNDVAYAADLDVERNASALRTGWLRA